MFGEKRLTQLRKNVFNKEFCEKIFCTPINFHFTKDWPNEGWTYVVTSTARSQSCLTSDVLLNLLGSVGTVVEQR